jgi:deazaflavin-dependent oxidoreductase (nitroreductase family)
MTHDPGINALNGNTSPAPNERIRNQVAVYEASARSRANTLNGYPVVILTTVGARSGTVRKNPAMRLIDGNRYVVVASAAGRSVHPLWYRNIVAHPIVRVQDTRPPAPAKPKKCVATRHRSTRGWPTTPSRSSPNTASHNIVQDIRPRTQCLHFLIGGHICPPRLHASETHRQTSPTRNPSVQIGPTNARG